MLNVSHFDKIGQWGTKKLCFLHVCNFVDGGIKLITIVGHSYPFTAFYISGDQQPVSIQLGNWPYIFTSEKVN